MKDGEKTYSTSQIAGIVGLHPNTVRKYEEWGLLQTPERKPNGYRVYTDVHIKQFELAKKALQSVIVQAGIRKMITVKRKQNGYRIYNAADMNRLKIIRSLRCANYSLTAIVIENRI